MKAETLVIRATTKINHEPSKDQPKDQHNLKSCKYDFGLSDDQRSSDQETLRLTSP